MTRSFAAAAALFCVIGLGLPAVAQTVAGDWHGALALTPTQALHLAVHLEKHADGTYSGTFVSLDQGPTPIPLADIVSSGESLSFTLPVTPKGSFSGQWDAKSGAWVGEWKQGGFAAPLTLSPSGPTKAPVLTGLDGAWDATLKEPNGPTLHLVLHVRTSDAGTTATLDSIDQLAYGMTVNAIHRVGDAVDFEMNAVGARFAGTLSADGKTLIGAWAQGGQTGPLTFTLRSGAAANAQPMRPQTPVKPYPYRAEDVSFDDGPGVKLAGTLTLPPGPGPFPAVVLVSGSGPNTRNEPILGHQIFLVLADHLTRRGIAVLRYDKRGVGQSTGDYAKATTQDFADDAESAVAYLRSRPEIDARRVGIIGHSEGGEIAPMVAVRDPRLAFIVMMAGPGVDGEAILLEQARLIGKAMGTPDAKLAEATALNEKLYTLVRAEKDPAAAVAKVKALLADNAAGRTLPTAAPDTESAAITSPWFRFFLDYDPAPTLAKVRCPVLALIGSLDLQVPPDQNLPAIRKALAANPDAEVVELPGLNHLFQDAKTGAPGEYGQIEETISPAAMDLMTNWILKHVRR
ncbi:MAG TPA: alpha/beta fold hydrolase [Caulobacteraceae bacterium]|nr:alpha/beta fold hydrolase [Caulobacteraceae bacterium]